MFYRRIQIFEPKRYYTVNDIIRDDFILENIYAFLLESYCFFNCNIRAMNQKEKKVLEHIKKLIKIFIKDYEDSVAKLVKEIGDFNENEFSFILFNVGEELFADGITWSRIIAFFIFVRGLGIQSISKKLPTSWIDVLCECSARFVKEKLCSWIENQGGWEEILTLDATEKKIVKEEPNWIRRLLPFIAIKILCTLEYIGNKYNYN